MNYKTIVVNDADNKRPMNLNAHMSIMPGSVKIFWHLIHQHLSPPHWCAVTKERVGGYHHVNFTYMYNSCINESMRGASEC